ncbi:carbohydrate ABC transporter permease [Microtetraspora malaysiensis]|uniref:carbohydrate ABC transporter permease n=1 Tax=Microtetraspora malaysiensis TaxID=161358 RepID=UPI000B1BD6AB|nr:carbohydrate ABC transporter permease [Microtetraspora malaysiensis]
MAPHIARRTRVALMTIVMFGIVVAFLAPLAQMTLTSLKSERQISQAHAPLLPSDPRTYTYRGQRYDVYLVPVDGAVRELALVKKGRTESGFVDPAAPEKGVITWRGSWRGLQPSWTLAPRWSNYSDVWNLIDFPRLLFNTVAIALIGTLGTVLSCTLVAYGFARFRFPGRGPLFTLLIATIFLPATVTLIPMYTVFAKIGWVGTWLPLLVPTFFANAYNVFLLRQYFMTIPREMDEAASIDGAGPLRTLRSVIVPQAWPAIAAVTLFHFVYTWNDYFTPLVYLSGQPDLQPLQVGLAAFNGLYTHNPAYIQAGTMMTIAVPVLLFVCFQRTFVRGIMSTGVDK